MLTATWTLQKIADKRTYVLHYTLPLLTSFTRNGMTHPLFHSISQALEAGNLAEAQRLISETKTTEQSNAMLYFLEGKLEMKQANWGAAMSCFLKAEALDADSPARECRLMLKDIMEFYNKDMFNQ